MKKRILTSAIAAALLVTGCISEEQQHVGSSDDAYFESIAASYRGIEGVMPTIGKIYIDNVTVGPNDGDLSNMRKADLNYTLSADLIVNDYSVLAGDNAKCKWNTTALGTSFTPSEGVEIVDSKNVKTALTLDETSGSYVCAPVKISFTKEGDEDNFDPDSIVTLSFTDNAGNPIKRVGYDATYTTSIVLNTADRHNILTVATSPTSVLFYRADGLFQAGFTAYRGLKGVEKYIGSATYEARVQSPGSTTKVDNSTEGKIDYNNELYKNGVTADVARMQQWLDNSSVDEKNGINSESAFVSSYGPPIALPPFREGLTEKDYRKLRLVLMRHNNFPIIISNDKKLYTMGRVSAYNDTELAGDYRFFIRTNDNWFQYSGVQLSKGNDYNKLHVGEIKIADGTPAKFVSTLSVTSDLGTIVSLNEYDKEYYIAGNPFYNEGFCTESQLNTPDFDNNTYSFNFSRACSYTTAKKVGAVKIPGLQKLIGDGEGVLATDTHIYYSGNDGKMYQIDLLPGGENYTRIRQGLPVIPRVIGLDETNIQSPIENKADRDKLYAVDLGLPNMNPVLAPTFLMNDGSIVFTARVYDPTTDNISWVRKHFYINEDPTKLDSKPGDLGNVPITNILGPTVGYGANGKLYYFTDIHSLGISYAPKANSNVDNDYLAFLYGDPVQQFGRVTNKADFFGFKFGELDITKALTNVNNADDIEGNNFVLMPYNPLTDAVDDIASTDNITGEVTFKAEAYRPFRTNSHLFVNMRKGAEYNYLLVPHYAYAFSYNDKVNKNQWVQKVNGLMAAEVRNNDISKVFGAFKNPKIPFKYTPYGRNTAFFANKKGVFAFTDYNVRKTENMCQEGSGCNIDTVTTLKDKKVPDYFYRARSTGTYMEESAGKNNYISTPFVAETRMSNIPDNTNYATKGFEPQLLSSWITYDGKRLPNTEDIRTSADPNIPGYIPQYFYETMKNRTGITFATEGGIGAWLGNMYQYAYGVGLYRYYDTNTYPVWRARKLGTEALQYQARYGTLLPMTHGATADYLFTNLVNYYKEGEIIKPNDEQDSETYVLPRIYTHAHYAFYDKDKLKAGNTIDKVVLGGMDISQKSITEYFTAANAAPNNTTIEGSGVGYIMDTGNYMWRAGSLAATTEGTVVSATNPMNKIEYFEDFVIVHK